jgi:hypothetical protein
MHRYGHLFSTLKTFRNTHGHLWTLLRLSHGENRGSSPLGSANDFSTLAAGISNFSPMDGASDDGNRRHRSAHEHLGELYLVLGDPAKAGQQLATLEEICLISCVETDDLKRAIAAYETLARR